MSESGRRILFVVLFGVVFFQTGAHVSQSFVNYPAWQFIDRASFPAYHRVMTVGAFRFLLVPRLVELALALVVLLFPPRPIQRWMLVLGIGLALGGFLSTAFVQRPIHVQLETIGNTPELLSRLRTTDWVRHGLEILRAALYLWMLSFLVSSRADSTQPSAAVQ
jgi:hypothetical protein